MRCVWLTLATVLAMNRMRLSVVALAMAMARTMAMMMMRVERRGPLFLALQALCAFAAPELLQSALAALVPCVLQVPPSHQPRRRNQTQQASHPHRHNSPKLQQVCFLLPRTRQ
jgi:hypothetical protein